MNPLIYGYLRICDDETDEQIRRTEHPMKEFAKVEGFRFVRFYFESVIRALLADSDPTELHARLSRTLGARVRAGRPVMDNLEEQILTGLKDINLDTGELATGILTNEISRDEQITFALCLIVLAEHIKERALKTPGMVVEGSIVDDCDSSDEQLPPGEARSHDGGQPPPVH